MGNPHTPAERQSADRDSLLGENGNTEECAYCKIIRLNTVIKIPPVLNRRTRGLFVGMIKALPFAAFFVNPSGLIRMVNDSGEEFLKKLRDEGNRSCCGTFRDLLSSPAAALECEKRFLTARTSGKSQSMEGAIRIGKCYKWNRIHLLPVRFRNEVWVLFMLEDLTPRMRLRLLRSKEYHGILEDRLRVLLLEYIEMRRNEKRDSGGNIDFHKIEVGGNTPPSLLS